MTDELIGKKLGGYEILDRIGQGGMRVFPLLVPGEHGAGFDPAQLGSGVEAIDALLDGLKPRTRRVFLLSRLEGKSYPAIARQLQVSLSTVEKDMAQALRHCYQVLMG